MKKTQLKKEVINNTMKKKTIILPDSTLILDLNRGFQPCSPRSWSRDIKNLYNNTCVLSGLNSNEASIVTHHLYSKKDNPNFQFNLLNGLPIIKELHMAYHKKFGMKTTAKSFINYIELLENTDSSFDPYNLKPASGVKRLKDWVLFLNYHLFD